MKQPSASRIKTLSLSCRDMTASADQLLWTIAGFSRSPFSSWQKDTPTWVVIFSMRVRTHLYVCTHTHTLTHRHTHIHTHFFLPFSITLHSCLPSCSPFGICLLYWHWLSGALESKERKDKAQITLRHEGAHTELYWHSLWGISGRVEARQTTKTLLSLYGRENASARHPPFWSLK
jgi:hypothetical protein